MECELLLLQPRLLPAWLARFEPSKENAAFRANREARTSHPRLAVCAKCCAWLITDLQCSSLRGRRLKRKGKGVLGAGETPEAREEGGRETPARRPLACVASVSVRFGSKERGTRVKHRAKNGLSKRAGRGFHFLALVSFLARPNPRIPFLGLSLLRNQTETLATQARKPLFFSFLTSTRRMLKSWLVRLLAGVFLPPFLLARFSRFPRAQNPVSLPFQTPATQAGGAAELRIAYGIDIVHYRTEGLKCLRLRLLKTPYLHSGNTVHISHNTPCQEIWWAPDLVCPTNCFSFGYYSRPKSSLYTDVVLFFFSIFSKTSTRSRACENEKELSPRLPPALAVSKYFITSARLYYE